jgi:hypothetical protein
MNPENRINRADIHLEGFTVDELRDIIGYIRSVEAHRESRVVIVNVDAPESSLKEALKGIGELWPDEEGPHFTLACSDDYLEKLIKRFEEAFGVYKKVVDLETGKTHRVPTRDIIEKGLKQKDLKNYPEWSNL